LAERRQPVVAGGGDGTVNAIAGKLAGSDTLPTKRNGVRCSNASA
jgi:diacylglycerol kinase family enzyme